MLLYLTEAHPPTHAHTHPSAFLPSNSTSAHMNMTSSSHRALPATALWRKNPASSP